MKFRPTFNYSLNNRVQEGCGGAARLEPGSTKETLVAVSTANKIIVRGEESSLHISDRVLTLAFLRIGEGRDALIVGTDGHLIAYDPHDNVTLFQREVPDGVSCITIGPLAQYGELILCGGNCAIWGFDATGNDVFWTVTGDRVTALCLTDNDHDGENELIVGSQDFEIRFFKGDLMREEIIETDQVTHLADMKRGKFAYALRNGSIGVYDGMNRLWRSKAKVPCVALFCFPSDDILTSVWQSGKVDIRKVDSGAEVLKETFPGGQVVAAFQSHTVDEHQYEVTLVFGDGKVRGLEVEQTQDKELDVALQLREFGQKKHNLLIELNNLEHEENMTPEDRKTYAGSVPAACQVTSRVTINEQELRLEVEVLASHDVPIRGAVFLAEGVFQGESYVALQQEGREQDDHLVVPIYPRKDHVVEMHIITFYGPVNEDIVHCKKSSHQFPRFCRFLPIETTPRQPKSKVELRGFDIRPNRMIEWAFSNISVPNPEATLQPVAPEETEITLTYQRLKPAENNYLIIRVEEGKLVIELDEMETVAAIVQALAEAMEVDEATAHAVFPNEMEQIKTIIDDLERMYEVRDRLATDISEKHALLKEMIVRAEDAIAIDEMQLARKYYTRLRNVERAVRQDYMLGANNHEKLVTSLRSLHKIIEMASKLRVGEPSRAIIVACREAVANDNLTIIPKIIEFGPS